MPAISDEKHKEVRDMYINGASMMDISKNHSVSLDAVVYFMRKHGIPRRSLKDASNKSFEKKKPSFSIKFNPNPDRELMAIALALYWAEGYKN